MRSPTTPMEAELIDAFHTPIPGDRFRRRGTSPLGSSAPRTQSKYVQRQSVDADDDENITDHKISQRSKQIKYGYNTPGYRNMMRLIDSDPRLRNGGVLPLAPPCTSLKVSKRAWDVLARKWRRALHLFDDVYIHEEDKDVTTLEEVIEQQRLKWVSSRNQHSDRTERLALSSASIMAARGNPSIPMRLPLEESMKPILRNPEYFQDLHRVVPDHASSLTRGNTGVSPTDAGIKMFIAPSAEAALFNVLGARDDDSLNLHSPTNGPRLSGSRGRSPSPDMPITPSTIVQMRTVHSPMQRSDRSPSPPPAQPAAPEPAPLAPAAAASSRLSPLAAPYCPPASVARSSPTDAIDATVRNYRPHHIQPQLSGLSIHHSLSSYNPHHSTAIRLENSFTSAVGDVSCGPALYAPPPPLVDRNAPATLYGATKQQPSMSS